MVEAVDEQNTQVESQGQGSVPSAFKAYLETHPDMTQQLVKTLLLMYQDPAKES